VLKNISAQCQLGRDQPVRGNRRDGFYLRLDIQLLGKILAYPLRACGRDGVMACPALSNGSAE